MPLRPGLHEYLEIVKAYRAGQVTAAMDSLARLAEKDVEDVTREIAADESQVAEPTTLPAACALHLDLIRRAGILPEIERIHLGALLRLLRKVRRTSPIEESTAVDVHLATAWFLQGQLVLTPLQKLLEALELRFPNDPRVALTVGTVYETLASRRLEAGRKAGLAPDRDGSLKKAEAQFRRAVQLDGGLAEAHLRLGRLLQAAEQPDAAFAEAGAALAIPDAPRLVRYLAQLLRTSILERRGAGDAALQALEAARAECACCSVPSLARSRILFDRGSAEAGSALSEALQPRECTDPWVWYDFGQSAQLDGLMASLRERLT